MAPTPTSLLTILPRSTQTSTPLEIPEAPPAPHSSATRTDGFNPSAIIGIVVAIVFLLLAVPLIAILLRRYERTQLRETPKSPASSAASLSSIREDYSLSSILVTKELSRDSMRVGSVRSGIGGVVGGVQRPEEVHGGGRERERGWSRTEVRGGEWSREK